MTVSRWRRGACAANGPLARIEGGNSMIESATKTAFVTVALAFGALLPGTAAAQQYPDKPVRMIVAWPPGGGTDAVARTVAKHLGGRLRQPVVIENRSRIGNSTRHFFPRATVSPCRDAADRMVFGENPLALDDHSSAESSRIASFRPHLTAPHEREPRGIVSPVTKPLSA